MSLPQFARKIYAFVTEIWVFQITASEPSTSFCIVWYNCMFLPIVDMSTLQTGTVVKHLFQDSELLLAWANLCLAMIAAGQTYSLLHLIVLHHRIQSVCPYILHNAYVSDKVIGWTCASRKQLLAKLIYMYLHSNIEHVP